MGSLRWKFQWPIMTHQVILKKVKNTLSCKNTLHDNLSTQTGGVMTLLANDIPPRIKSTSSDPYRQWTQTELYTKTNPLVIYNTYRTHQKTLITAGIHTPWMQQWRAITQDQKLSDVDPRSQHIVNLITICVLAPSSLPPNIFVKVFLMLFFNVLSFF